MSFPQLHPATPSSGSTPITALIESEIIAGMNDCRSANEIAESIAAMLANRAQSLAEQVR